MNATSADRYTQLARRPRSVSWRWKTAATIAAWIGAAFALFLTVFLAATGGIDATRFNTPGIIAAAGVLSLAGACAGMSILTKVPARPARTSGWGEVEEVAESGTSDDVLAAVGSAAADR